MGWKVIIGKVPPILVPLPGPEEKPVGPNPAVTLDVAKQKSGLYIVDGDCFVPVKAQQSIRTLFEEATDYKVLLLDPEDRIPKIPNTAQLVLFGKTFVTADKILQDGYTIPYQVEFGHKLEPNSKVCTTEGKYYGRVRK